MAISILNDLLLFSCLAAVVTGIAPGERLLVDVRGLTDRLRSYPEPPATPAPPPDARPGRDLPGISVASENIHE